MTDATPPARVTAHATESADPARVAPPVVPREPRPPQHRPRRVSLLSPEQAKQTRRTGSLAFGIMSMGANAMSSVLTAALILWLIQVTLIDLFEGLDYEGWGVAVQGWLRSLDFSPLLPWALGVSAFGLAVAGLGWWLSVRGLRRAGLARPHLITWVAALLGMLVQGCFMVIGSMISGITLPFLIPTVPNIVAIIIGIVVVSTLWSGLVGALVGPLMWWGMARALTGPPEAPTAPTPAR